MLIMQTKKLKCNNTEIWQRQQFRLASKVRLEKSCFLSNVIDEFISESSQGNQSLWTFSGIR